MKLINHLPSQGNVLFLSNGCGGGHIQTVASLEAEMKAKRPQIKTTTIDIYKNSFGHSIGNRIINRWSRQQKEGDIAGLNHYLKYQWVDRYVLAPITFFRLVGALLKNDIDIVVNVQPFGLGPLLSAVRVVNFIRRFFSFKKRGEIQVSMLLTELPNRATRNFFPPIKNLWASDLKYFTLYASPPLLEQGETEKEFWKVHCNLPLQNVRYDELPVRQAFFDQKKEPRPHSLAVRVDSNEHRQQIIECSRGAPASHQPHHLTFQLAPTDTLLSIHLGGQACIPAAKEYLASRMVDPTPRLGKEYIFVLCGEHNSKDSLFAQVVDMVKGKQVPAGLHIVPLTRQTDVEIAPILARSNAAIIKSGGLTSMEVMTVPPNQILIHSMCPKGVGDPEEMIQKGMPVWEGGNARYLMNAKKARVVTPETIGNQIYG